MPETERNANGEPEPGTEEAGPGMDALAEPGAEGADGGERKTPDGRVLSPQVPRQKSGLRIVLLVVVPLTAVVAALIVGDLPTEESLVAAFPLTAILVGLAVFLMGLSVAFEDQQRANQAWEAAMALLIGAVLAFGFTTVQNDLEDQRADREARREEARIIREISAGDQPTVKNFDGLDLQSQTLTGLDLTEASFVGSDLTAVRLSLAVMVDANLQDARLVDAELVRANLERADLTGADLTGADLRAALLIDANVINANLERAQLQNAVLTNANLRNADLPDATMAGACIGGANLSGAVLTGAVLSGVNLTGAHLRGADLEDANLFEANINGADLTDAVLTGANLTRIVYNSSTVWPEGFQPPRSS